MATHKGRDGTVKLGSDVVGEVRGFTITESASTVDDTVMGDQWMTHQQIHKSWTAEVNVLFDPDDTTGQNAITIGGSVSLNLFPLTDGSGDPEFSGTATCTGREIGTTHDGLVELQLSFEGNGALAQADVA